jgi:predicted amidophosphoribosyltransferase
MMVNMKSWYCNKSDDAVNVFLEQDKYILLKEPYCRKCAYPGVETGSCRNIHHSDGFDSVCAVGIYQGAANRKKDLLTDHILNLKEDPTFAEPLGLAMGIAIRALRPELLESEVLVPVPLHAEEITSRGYNQAIELAKILTKDIKIPSVEALIKTRSVSFHNMRWAARKAAAQNLYQVDSRFRSQIYGKKILLVDDVMTSGITCAECASMLKSEGAKSVNVAVAGRTIPRW